MFRTHYWTNSWFAAIGGAAILQVFTVLIGSAFVYGVLGSSAAVAASYGGTVALANTLFLVWRMRQGEQQLDANVSRQLLSFYRSSLERFVIVGLLLATGMGVLHLAGLPLLAGFVFGQVSLMVFQFLRAI
jgi:ATP synthase protein I